MTPENRQQVPVTKELNPGIVPIEEGGERPHTEDAPSIQDVNTGEIPTLLPDHSGQLILTDEERSSEVFQEKTDAQRAYHEQRTNETETGWSPSGNESLPGNVEQKKKGKSKLLAVLGGTAAAAVATVSLFLLPKGDNTNNNQPAPTQPVATGEVTTSKSPELSKEEKIKALELKVDQPNEALATDIVNKISAWHMAGATPENYKSRDITLTVEDYAAKIAAEQGEAYATAIFGANYAANPQLANYVDAMIKINARNIVYYIKTFDPKLDPANIEPFKQVMIVDNLVSATPTANGLNLVINYHQETNEGKNYIDSAELNGTKESMTITLAKNGNIYTATSASVDDPK